MASQPFGKIHCGPRSSFMESARLGIRTAQTSCSSCSKIPSGERGAKIRFANRSSISLFLCGDVMTGRGIDQILPYPAEPSLFEPLVRDARDYVTLAEQRNGPIPQPVDFAYIWG